MLPVLMYHGLHADGAGPGHFDPVYSVHPDRFARQLDGLLAKGYRTVRLDAACDHPNAAGKSVVISFDDGDVSNALVALPLLRQRGMVAEFFITSDFIGQPGWLDADGIRALAEAGMGIGSHGRSHRFLEDLDAGEMEAELRDSKTRLEAICRRPVDAIALPGGRGARREHEAARALGYRHLLGSVPGTNRHPGSARWLQRIAVTRDMSERRFHDLVQWRGLAPRLVLGRHLALGVPKRVLGNAGYERLRARLL